MVDLEESRFERDHATALEALRRERRECPDPDLLVSWARGELDAIGDPSVASERDLVETHLGTCIACLEAIDAARTDSSTLDDIAWARVQKRLDERSTPWTEPTVDPSARLTPRLVIFAATLLVGAVLGSSAVVFFVRQPMSSTATPVAIERGSQIQLVDPEGVPDGPIHFEWSFALPSTLAFRVEVAREDEVVWSELLPPGQGRRLDAPPELETILAGGGAHRWRVIGLSAAGNEVARSDWAELRPASPRAPPERDDP